jgi:hypothetical protein
MHTPNVITQGLTKWHIQLMHIHQILHFLSLEGLNFCDLFLHVMGLNVGYVTLHSISKVHKNPHNFGYVTLHSIEPQSSSLSYFCYIL